MTSAGEAGVGWMPDVAVAMRWGSSAAAPGAGCSDHSANLSQGLERKTRGLSAAGHVVFFGLDTERSD